jgi:hypothetical protein
MRRTNVILCLWLASSAWTVAGSAEAAGCVSQRPELFAPYRHRPAWRVAGVDYCVGVPEGSSLKAPATMAVAGASADSSRHVVIVSGDNVKLDGYDFSLDGGWGVVIEGKGTTLSNSRFAVGANGVAPILGLPSSGDVTVTDSTIDGANSPDVGGLVEMRGAGVLTILRSWLRNSGGDMVQMHNRGAAALVLEQNLFENSGMSPGAHGDWTEFIGGPFTVRIAYNTALQNGGSTQGFMVEPDVGSSRGVVTSGEIANNTMSGSVSVFTGVTVADIVKTFSVHDNYFDPSRTLGGLAFSGVRGGPMDASAKTFYDRNVDMRTGAIVCKGVRCQFVKVEEKPPG